MQITLTLEATDVVLLASIDAFVKNNGWTEETDTPAIEFAKQTLINYFRQQVLDYNAAKLGTEAAQVQGALSMVDVSLDLQ